MTEGDMSDPILDDLALWQQELDSEVPVGPGYVTDPDGRIIRLVTERPRP